ncbi:MAG: hypothetical protein ACLP2P_11735 [Desulfobaccales bacterium]
MKKLKLITLVEAAVVVMLVCLLVVLAWGQDRSIPYFIGVKSYLGINDHEQESYVAGAADAFKLMTVMKPEELNIKLFDSFTRGMRVSQVHTTVNKFLKDRVMKDYPQDCYLYPMADIVIMAIVTEASEQQRK